jgi:serine/threonine protein kinase
VRSLIFTENRANHIPGPDDTETKKHVIQLLASFEVHNSNSTHPTYYLLFPWADGNLEEFWKQQDGAYSPRNQVQTGWMIDQFYHLAKALQCLHNDRKVILSQRTDSNRYGRHGDIKPGNFLFFCDNSGLGFELVLADFGLGRLHSKASKSMQPPNVSKTATYAAPEYDIEGGLLSPRSDIFSLGCVFLEHIVWLFHGYKAVEAFTDERMAPGYYGFESDTFWKVSDSDRTSVEIKDTVSKRLTTLKNHDDCVEVIGEILEVIEKRMLQPGHDERCTSQDLVNELERIRVQWARRDSFYGTRAWKKSRLPKPHTLPPASGHF